MDIDKEIGMLQPDKVNTEIEGLETQKSQVEKQLDENPALYGKFKPATNFLELQQLHQTYTSDVVDFEEIDESDNKDNMAKKNNNFEEKEENLTGKGF